jgi:hypothetical protein
MSDVCVYRIMVDVYGIIVDFFFIEIVIRDTSCLHASLLNGPERRVLPTRVTNDPYNTIGTREMR